MRGIALLIAAAVVAAPLQSSGQAGGAAPNVMSTAPTPPTPPSELPSAPSHSEIAPAPATPIDLLADLEQAVARASENFDPAAVGDEPIRRRVLDCWRPPVLNGALDAAAVTVAFNLSPDGDVLGEPALTAPAGALTQDQQAVASSAIAAIFECAPYAELPRARYEEWRELAVTFDPVEFGP